MINIINYIKSYITNIDIVPLLIAAFAITIVSIEPSYAQNFTGITAKLTLIANALVGPVGKSICLLGVAGVGFTFMTGRMDWPFALAIVVGIIIIFTAASFVNGFTVA